MSEIHSWSLLYVLEGGPRKGCLKSDVVQGVVDQLQLLTMKRKYRRRILRVEQVRLALEKKNESSLGVCRCSG